MTNVNTPAAALEAARNHYAAAIAAHDALQDAYARPSDLPTPRFVAKMQDAVRFGLKAGDLAAHIAIAGDLIEVAADITRARLEGSTAGKTSSRVLTLSGEEL